MVRSIYTDKETEKILEEIKAKDENFELSAFVKLKLKEFTGITNTKTIPQLADELEQLKYQEHTIKAKQDDIREQISQLRAKKEADNIKQISENQKLRIKQQEKYHIFKNNLSVFFDIEDKELIESLAIEYSQRDIKDIVEFMQDKGFIFEQEETKEESKKPPVFIKKPITKESSDELYNELMQEASEQ